MAHSRKEVKGAAVALTLASGINNSQTNISANGSVTGWPTGASFPFVIQIDDEKILCTSLTGSGPATITATTRGFDETTAATHSASAPIRHVLDADTLAELMAHAYNTALDDHTQYIKTDGTRAFSGVTAIAGGAPPDVATAAAAGSALTFSRSDHVHKLANGAINNSALFASGVVGAAAIADGSVGTAELADESVNFAKMNQDVPHGGVGTSYASTDQTGLTSTTVVSNLSVSLNPDTDRILKITAQVTIDAETGTMPAEFLIRILKDGTPIWSHRTGISNDIGISSSRSISFVGIDDSLSAGTRTYTVDVQSPTGTQFAILGSQAAKLLLIEDIGI